MYPVDGTIDGTLFLGITLVTIYGLFGFIFYQRHLFNLGAIFNNCPKFKI